MKAGLREKFVALSKLEERSKINNLNFHFRETQKDTGVKSKSGVGS